MKPTIIVEGASNLTILKALLPPALVDACAFRATGRGSTLVSVARTHLVKHHTPVAILFDTKTLDPTIIAETVRTTRHLMSAVSGGTPFDVIYCVPHLEGIFFEAPIDHRKIFPNFDNAFVLPFAKTQPKDQLTRLLQIGGGPSTLPDFLNALTSEDTRLLQRQYPIGQLMAFIENNRAVPVSSN